MRSVQVVTFKATAKDLELLRMLQQRLGYRESKAMVIREALQGECDRRGLVYRPPGLVSAPPGSIFAPLLPELPDQVPELPELPELPDQAEAVEVNGLTSKPAGKSKRKSKPPAKKASGRKTDTVKRPRVQKQKG